MFGRSGGGGGRRRQGLLRNGMGDKKDFLLIPIKIQPALKNRLLEKSFISAPGRGGMQWRQTRSECGRWIVAEIVKFTTRASAPDPGRRIDQSVNTAVPFSRSSSLKANKHKTREGEKANFAFLDPSVSGMGVFGRVS